MVRSVRARSASSSPSTEALIAHILRRTTFGPFPGQVEAYARRGVPAALDAVLRARPLAASPAPLLTDDTSDAPVTWWLDRMAQPKAGIHEKLTWFWHGHLTTSHDKVFNWRLEFPEHRLLRTHALGNFRALLQAITVDPAMLVYLDGDGSNAIDPNENYGRELMELFCLGRAQYTQADVRAGARALAGWWVNGDTGEHGFDPSAALEAPVTYLGRSVSRAADVVNAVCDHPACALWVSGRVYRFLTGLESSTAPARTHAARFRKSGLEIRPLVEAIVRDPAFLRVRLNRPRTPVEWTIAALAALGLTDPALRLATLQAMGQVPFYPPNVSGWPWGLRWLSPSFALARAAFATNATGIASVAAATDPVAATLRRCSLYEVSSKTRTVLAHAADSVSDRGSRAAVLLGLAVGSPEFALA